MVAASARASQVKDRFKGKRTKYYVLKAFASTAEVTRPPCDGTHPNMTRTDPSIAPTHR